MARQKKTRKINDVMPVRKTDKRPEPSRNRGKTLTRYELDAKAREDKKKRKHKGLVPGSRLAVTEDKREIRNDAKRDPRLGSRKKVPLVVEFINQPDKGKFIQPVVVETKSKQLDPTVELERLENNEILNELLDQVEAGKTLNREDQQFVDDCLDRIEQLIDELGIPHEDESEDDLYRTFEKIDINQFR